MRHNFAERVCASAAVLSNRLEVCLFGLRWFWLSSGEEMLVFGLSTFCRWELVEFFRTICFTRCYTMHQPTV